MVTTFRELRVYREAFLAARRIFHVSKQWPKEERYALTGQIRRSSRSVNANIAEAWRKRRYRKHFISKLSDADAEAAETRAWLDFAVDYAYISDEMYVDLDAAYDQVQSGLVAMMRDAPRWCGPAKTVREEMPTYFTDEKTPLK